MFFLRFLALAIPPITSYRLSWGQMIEKRKLWGGVLFSVRCIQPTRNHCKSLIKALNISDRWWRVKAMQWRVLAGGAYQWFLFAYFLTIFVKTECIDWLVMDKFQKKKEKKTGFTFLVMSFSLDAIIRTFQSLHSPRILQESADLISLQEIFELNPLFIQVGWVEQSTTQPRDWTQNYYATKFMHQSTRFLFRKREKIRIHFPVKSSSTIPRWLYEYKLFRYYSAKKK